MAQIKTVIRKMKAMASDMQMTRNWPPHRPRPTPPRIPLFRVDTKTMSDKELLIAQKLGMLGAPVL